MGFNTIMALFELRLFYIIQALVYEAPRTVEQTLLLSALDKSKKQMWHLNWAEKISFN
jgi:hypothetical protein